MGLGVDGSASNDAGSLLHEARLACFLQRAKGDVAGDGRRYLFRVKASDLESFGSPASQPGAAEVNQYTSSSEHGTGMHIPFTGPAHGLKTFLVKQAPHLC